VRYEPEPGQSKARKRRIPRQKGQLSRRSQARPKAGQSRCPGSGEGLTGGYQRGRTDPEEEAMPPGKGRTRPRTWRGQCSLGRSRGQPQLPKGARRSRKNSGPRPDMSPANPTSRQEAEDCYGKLLYARKRTFRF